MVFMTFAQFFFIILQQTFFPSGFPSCLFLVLLFWRRRVNYVFFCFFCNNLFIYIISMLYPSDKLKLHLEGCFHPCDQLNIDDQLYALLFEPTYSPLIIFFVFLVSVFPPLYPLHFFRCLS